MSLPPPSDDFVAARARFENAVLAMSSRTAPLASQAVRDDFQEVIAATNAYADALRAQSANDTIELFDALVVRYGLRPAPPERQRQAGGRIPPPGWDDEDEGHP